MRIEIWPDSYIENPSDFDCNWKVYSFCRSHINSSTPDEFITSNGNWRFEYARKASVGLVFPLSYFEHGDCVWSIRGEGMNCPWDSVQFAGVAVFNGKPSDMGAKTYDERAKDLRRFLESYNAWCNGHGCGFSVYDDEVELIDSCGGFYGSEDCLEYLKSEHPELSEIEPEYVTN